MFEAWGIGKKYEDNGVLLLVAIQERAALRDRLGSRARSPTAWQARMLRNVVVPPVPRGRSR